MRFQVLDILPNLTNPVTGREIRTRERFSQAVTSARYAEEFGYDAVDGFNIVPQRLPGTVADIAERLVPELQERGIYRAEYTGTTLRDHLDLR